MIGTNLRSEFEAANITQTETKMTSNDVAVNTGT